MSLVPDRVTISQLWKVDFCSRSNKNEIYALNSVQVKLTLELMAELGPSPYLGKTLLYLFKVVGFSKRESNTKVTL